MDVDRGNQRIYCDEEGGKKKSDREKSGKEKERGVQEERDCVSFDEKR